MKQLIEFVAKAFVTGLLILVPVYLSVLLLLKAMQSAVGFVRPFAMLLPEWLPAENLLSLSPCVDCLFPHRCCHPHAGRASDPGAHRKIPF